MITDVDCDCICDYLNLSMPALALYGFDACARFTSFPFASSPWTLLPRRQGMGPTCLSALLYSEFGRRLICVAETLSLRARIPVRVLFRSPDF